jgi:hypothetical protein
MKSTGFEGKTKYGNLKRGYKVYLKAMNKGMISLEFTCIQCKY